MLGLTKVVVSGLMVSAVLAVATPVGAATASGTAPTGATAGATTAPLKGKILSFNYGGRGEVQGFMLGGGDKPVQINLPNEMGDALKALHAGDAVEVTPRTEAGRGEPGPAGRGEPGPAGRGPQEAADHEVYEAAALTDAQGHTYARPGPGEHAAREQVKVESTLKAFNYDHRGMPDGLQLANGDLVRLGGAASKLKLTANQAIAVEGDAETLASGVRLIHATKLNGEALNDAPPPPPPGGEPRGRRGGGAGGPGGDGVPAGAWKDLP
jgi:hypothetical protein